MPREVEFAIKRYEVFLRDVLVPAVYSSASVVEVEAWQWTDIKASVPRVEQAARQQFQPVKIGWQWGPKWSTCWFRVRGEAPESELPLHLRFSTATEALVYERKGDASFEIVQGLDVNRDVLINRPLASGEKFEFLIEAACNHPFGVTGFEWDDPEVHARWKSETPGRLDRCEIAKWNQPCERLATAYRFAVGLLKEMPQDDARALAIHAALREATNLVSDRDVSGTANGALRVLHQALGAGAGPTASSCIAVGHAHIDTAWLWPLRETRRKCLRTFSNVLGLMERNPEFHFMCSQAQQYEHVRQDNPALFARITEAVQRGQWEPVGGMWIEPDANCPSGESLIRQCLHGTRFWTSLYGSLGAQRLLYLPDTFGFPASLPGIMTHCGLDTFVTNKLHWNSSNDFPHSTFEWMGIDGSVVLGHNTPGKDYNATNSPKELKRGRGVFDRCHPPTTAAPSDAVPDIWLQPFGYGDGGGGPTQQMIDQARLATDAALLPRTKLGSARGFIQALHDKRAAMSAAGKSLPLVLGELYLELHRGTLTTQAWIKKANREAENALHAAEFLAFFAPIRPCREVSDEIMRDLDRAWKLLLLNQFHDILPGSSIGWVYEDARKDFAEIDTIVRGVIEHAMPLWSESVCATDGKCVINPFDTQRNELTADRAHAQVAGPCSISALQSPRVPIQLACTGDEKRLSNGLLTIELDDCGRIVAIIPDAKAFPGVASRRVRMNQLVMYEDRPHMWDAWDIDATYVDKPEPVNHVPCQMRVVERSPLRIAVECSRSFGAGSRVAQVISLDSGSALIRVRAKVDWQEDHRLLRVLHAGETTASHADCGIQCGAIRRPLVPQTPQDAAKFEFCAHGFVAVGDAAGGFAVLCPDKYGWSARSEQGYAVIGISLLRATTHPDPQADRGTHEFEYAILPLSAAPSVSELTKESDRLGSSPMTMSCATQPTQSDSINLDDGAWSPFEVLSDGSAQIRIIATKRAEDCDSDLVIRLHDSGGNGGTFAIRWNLPVTRAWPVSGLEESVDDASHALQWHSESRTVRGLLQPFGIVAIRVKLAMS
ncbi:MAG: hypothetical protein KGS45_13530 [Planctomycetes bacterium]|nr:hypothetical protein [Planctomycetota bacterium]